MQLLKNKPLRQLLLIPVLLLAFSDSAVYSQTGSYENLYFVKDGEKAEFNKKDYMPDKKGFYIYRNCIYVLVLKNKMQFFAKVIEIKNDSLYYTAYINENVAQKNNSYQDTLSMHPSSIKRIKLIGDRIMGIYANQPLGHYSYVFEQDIEPKKFKTYFDTVYTKDSSRATTYELIPYLTAQGLDQLYEQCGITYYFRGSTNEECSDTAAKKFISKKGIWFSPSDANEVHGVNIGIQTMNAGGDPLSIHGVNLSADLLSLIGGMIALFYVPFGNAMINLPDSGDVSGIVNTVKGLSISAGGLIGDNQVNGVSINGGIFTAIKTKGLVVTGSQNLIDDFKGVVVSVLRNRSSQGKGIQIGLLNVCKHMKGIQIGLWNVNSKRKLPFINWSF